MSIRHVDRNCCLVLEGRPPVLFVLIHSLFPKDGVRVVRFRVAVAQYLLDVERLGSLQSLMCWDRARVSCRLMSKPFG